MKPADSPVADQTELEQRVAYWKKNRVEMGLHEFLGWTQAEAEEWTDTRNIPQSVKNRARKPAAAATAK